MDHRSELVEVIRRVRNRWRLRLAARGAVVVFAGTVLVLLLSASGLETFRFSVPAIIAFRILTRRRVRRPAVLRVRWPLRRRVTDTQVALYLEEHNPTLEAAILSAVEATADGRSPDHSPQLVEKLVEQAIAQCRAVEHGRAIDRAAVQRHAVDAGGRRRARRAHRRLGPAYLRHGLSALLIISRSAEAASPYRIEVTPGQHESAARRGSDGPREARWLHRQGRQRHDADGAERAVRTPAAHAAAGTTGRSKA